MGACHHNIEKYDYNNRKEKWRSEMGEITNEPKKKQKSILSPARII